MYNNVLDHVYEQSERGRSARVYHPYCVDNVSTLGYTNHESISDGGEPILPTDPTESGGQTRDININIRAKRAQRDLIDQAAELLGKTRSDFMLETACREAVDVLLDQRVFTLDAAAFEKFQALLDAPPADNPKLRALMATKAPWEP
jgi:uncharacterized protein (DUF1778 family)